MLLLKQEMFTNIKNMAELIPERMSTEKLSRYLNGICIDDLDITCSVYHTDVSFLKTENLIR